MTRILSVFGAVSLLFLFSCNRSDRQPIESDVYVTVQKNGDDVEIICVTEKIYECTNYLIRFRLRQVNDGRIRAELRDVVVPEACQTATGPAYCTMVSQDLPLGSYPITFELNGQETNGTLNVGASSVELTLDQGGNVKEL